MNPETFDGVAEKCDSPASPPQRSGDNSPAYSPTSPPYWPPGFCTPPPSRPENTSADAVDSPASPPPSPYNSEDAARDNAALEWMMAPRLLQTPPPPPPEDAAARENAALEWMMAPRRLQTPPPPPPPQPQPRPPPPTDTENNDITLAWNGPAPILKYEHVEPVPAWCPTAFTNEHDCRECDCYRVILGGGAKIPKIDPESDSDSSNIWSESESNTETESDYTMYSDCSEDMSIDENSDSDEDDFYGVDCMKWRMRDSFKAINRVYSNYQLLMENIDRDRNNLSVLDLARGEYLPLDLSKDMIEKCRAKMVESLHQVKNIAMLDIWGVMTAGQRLCNMENIRDNLIEEHASLKKWTDARLVEMQQRIDFFNEHIGTLVKVNVTLKNGESVDRSKYPIWTLVRPISNNSLCSAGYLGECDPIKYILGKCKKYKMDHKRAVEKGDIICKECSVETGDHCDILKEIDRCATVEIDEHKGMVVTGFFNCDKCEKNEVTDIEFSDSDDSGNEMQE